MLSKARGIALAAGASLVLGACGMADGKRDGVIPPVKRPFAGRGALVSDLPVKIGTPYTVGGVTYTPVDKPNYDEVGFASWYGEEVSGNDTANGEAFNPAGVSAAHKTLPLPSYVEITALDTGRTILVRVNDRGPFASDRIIDLSRGAAEQLGLMARGPVRVRRVNPLEQEKAALRRGVRAAERMVTPKALLVGLRARLGEEVRTVPIATAAEKPVDAGVRVSAPALVARNYIVQVASFSSRDRAEALAKRIGAHLVETSPMWRVRLGPYPNRAAAKAGVDQAASKGFRDAAIMAND